MYQPGLDWDTEFKSYNETNQSYKLETGCILSPETTVTKKYFRVNEASLNYRYWNFN